MSSAFSIELIPQDPRALERYHLSLAKHQIFPGLRIPPFPFPFLLHIEFPKPSDQKIFAVFKSPFDEFYKGFNHLFGFGFGEA